MILVSHPTGNAFVKALLQALSERNQLDSFHTTISKLPGDDPLSHWLNQKLERRSFPIAPEMIEHDSLREFVRLLAPQIGLTFLTTHECGWASTDSVYQHLDKVVAQRLKTRAHRGASLPTGIYSYEDACAITFKQAKELDLRCFYDLPIAYFETSQRLLAEEAQRWPQWEITLGATSDSAAKLERKQQEINYSDVVVCPSRFVLNTLPERIRQEKTCLVSEFGTPKQREQNDTAGGAIPRDKNGPLRVLFAGSLSQRKGLADLFKAIELVNRKDVELVVMGSPTAPMSFYRSQLQQFTYEPPRPQAEVFRLMQSCDVLALPSIVEGRALVQQEAMSCGLPILVTANAGGEDLVDEGKTGFLVPIRSPENLAEKINWLADHREETVTMGENAKIKARELTWERYANKILDTIKCQLPG